LAINLRDGIVMDIGTRIREVRKKVSLSIRQLSEKVGVSYLTMQRIETDKISPSVMLLAQIADVLHYPIASFLEEKEKSFVLIRREQQNVMETKMLRLRLLASKGVIGDNIAVTLGKTHKGRFISRHKNEGFEFAYVVKGGCVFRYGKERYELQEGDVIYFDASEWHSVTAIEPHEFFGIQFFSK
jgi:transcriptional regulator with XRE-family HTH domain